MLIDMRKDAPDQAKTIDPDALSTEVEKLQGIQKQIKDLEDRVKDLKEDEKYFSCNIIPKLMEDMNLASLKLKDGSVMKEWKDKGHEVPAELFNTFDGNQTYLKNKK